jgi:hypothetical protein
LIYREEEVMKTVKERRKHKRHSVNNNSAALLVFPTIILSYCVLDISYSGVGFCYAGWENWPTEGLKIDIIDERFFLENIPISVINDVHLHHESKKLRRCGVEFNSFEADRMAILSQYIERLEAN